MKKNIYLSCILSMLMLSLGSAFAQSNRHWDFAPDGFSIPQGQLMQTQLPKTYQLVRLNVPALYQELSDAYRAPADAPPLLISIPNPEGGYSEFFISPTQVVAEEVAHLYTAKTFKGYAKNARQVTLRCGISPTGFHAVVFNGGVTYVIESASRNDITTHIVYYKSELEVPGFRCEVDETRHREGYKPSDWGAPKTPAQLRTYRIAIIADNNYRTQFGGMPYDVANVLNSLAMGVNDMNGVYERDMGVRFMLVSNAACANAVLTNHNNNTQVHNFLVGELTVGGFDVGHSVIWANIGGAAGLGVVCFDSQKGRGHSGSNASFTQLYIDYVCHEVGHQMDANHTFAADECSNSVNNFRFEPGEGSTIMAYAGVCGAPPSYQSVSDPFFHAASLAEMHAYMANTNPGFGGSCGITSMPGTGNNAAPVVNAQSNITIPKQTPFILVGSGTDANSDPVSFSWQQYDGTGGVTTGSPDCNTTTQPLFRFRPPVSDNFRIFPPMSNVLAGNNNGSAWEKLPCAARTMNFRLTARDNNTNWGRTAFDDMVVTVADTGPFNVTAPNGGESWAVSSTQNVTWTVNGTDAHCASVDVLISTDNGATYTVLGTFPNNGSASVTMPGTASTTARVLVQCSVGGNFRSASTFFDVSNAVFSIIQPPMFGAGNIVLLQAEASSTNTTARIIEVNTTNASQTAISDIAIDGTGTNAMRFSGSATSTGYLSNSNDRSLLLFTGHNNTNTSSNANTLNPRAVGTMDVSQTFSLATTYTGGSGNQTRSATTLNNTDFFIADAGGIYTNGSTSASPSGNVRGIKAFGGTVYVGQTSSTSTVIQVSTVSALSGGTITGLPGLMNNNNFQDFYLIQSGSNGSTFDVLYVVISTSNTAGTIAKYSLVSGTWAANGTYTTTFGGFGLAAQKSGNGAELFVSTGQGALTTNSVIKLTDAAGYNATININTASNVTLYTAPTGRIIKGVAFAPQPACPVLTSAPGEVQITDSSCGTGCTVSGGQIQAPATGCPAGSSIQYKVGTGDWSSSLPMYNQTGPAQTIQTRCICDADANTFSIASAGVTTAPGTCDTPGAPTLTITNNVCPSTMGTISATGCGAGTVVEYATNAGGPWSTTAPTYTTTAFTVYARCRNTTTECVSSTVSETTAPTACSTCPVLSSAPGEVQITNSTCGTGCTVSGGQIQAPTTGCPAGSSIQYKVGTGDWSSSLPMYNQTGPAQTIQTRCICDADANTFSIASAGVTTAPGTCDTPGAPTLTITNNVCPSTTGTISATGCGAGTVVEYATNAGGPWSTTAPTYTTTAFTVYARCRNTTTECVSSTVSETTAPVNCPPVVCPGLRISQVYGGGGNTYTHDFVELFNAGSTPVSLNGLSIQYASATGTGNFGSTATQLTELPNVMVQPGRYFLIQQDAGATTTALPTPDHIDPTPITISATAGKVALVNSTTSLGCNGGSTPCNAAQLALIIDLVGYGNANFFEGSAAAPTLTNTTAALRANNGCTDTDNNSADFATGVPNPRNSASPVNGCGLMLTITNNVCPSTTGTISATGCGTGTVLEYATDVNGPWSTTAPAYTETPLTVYVRCRNTTTNCSGPVLSGTTAPGDCAACPDLTSAPGQVQITNSTCNTSCTASGGLIEAPAAGCPAGSSIQYKVGTGGWSSILPIYNQNGPAQTIETRCVCDLDNNVVSPVSTATTAPGCTIPGTPVLTVTDNACPSTPGSISATGCGAGTVVEYATNATGPWSETAPAYTSLTITVYARCRNTTTNCVSDVVSKVTNPINCSPNCGEAYWNMTIDPVTTNTVPNTSFGTIGRGNNNGTTTLITTGSASSGYAGASGGGNAGAAARIGALNTGANGSAYFEVVVTPNPGRIFTFTGIRFGSRSTLTGPQAYSVRTSADNYAAEVAGDTVSNNSIWNLKNRSGLSVASGGGQPLTIRIYGYNGSGSPVVGTANWRIDDLMIFGCDDPAPCPDLSATPGNVQINNGTCGASCESIGAGISAPTTGCPAGSTLQYSVNNGTWSNTLPMYAALSSGDTIKTRCVCLADAQITSPVSAGVPVGRCVDSTPPQITCNNTAVTFNGQAFILLSAAALVSASDNCGIGSISISNDTIFCTSVGQVVQRVITVTDVNGNPATCNVDITVGGLPCGWSQNTNGVGCTNGNSIAFNPATAVWTATSTNCYYAPPFSSDSHAFAQRQLCGNGSITVRIDNINGQGWAGIVMRETNAPGAKKAQLMTNLSSFNRMEFRAITDAQAYPQQIPFSNRRWLRITRTGNQFQMFTSLNGITWQVAGAQNIVMANCIQVGLVLTNFSANSTISATFSMLEVQGSNTPLGLPGNGVAALAPDLSPLTPDPSPLTPDFSVFPNPTTGELNVGLTQYIGRGVRIELYGIEGKLLQFTELDEVQTKLEGLDLKGFQHGMYLVKVKSAGLPDVTRRVVLR